MRATCQVGLRVSRQRWLRVAPTRRGDRAPSTPSSTASQAWSTSWSTETAVPCDRHREFAVVRRRVGARVPMPPPYRQPVSAVGGGRPRRGPPRALQTHPRLPLTAGLLRLLDGDFPDREFLPGIAEHHLDQALALAAV